MSNRRFIIGRHFLDDFRMRGDLPVARKELRRERATRVPIASRSQR